MSVLTRSKISAQDWIQHQYLVDPSAEAAKYFISHTLMIIRHINIENVHKSAEQLL